MTSSAGEERATVSLPYPSPPALGGEPTDGFRSWAGVDTGVNHPNAGAIVVQPKADQRGRER